MKDMKTFYYILNNESPSPEKKSKLFSKKPVLNFKA